MDRTTSRPRISLQIKELIIQKTEDGLTQLEIADDLNVSQSTVSETLTKFRDRGHLLPLTGSGRKATYSDDELLELKLIVNQKPDLTLVEYAECLAKRFDKSVLSTSQMHRIMVKLGLTRKKKSKFAEEQLKPENKKKTRLS